MRIMCPCCDVSTHQHSNLSSIQTEKSEFACNISLFIVWGTKIFFIPKKTLNVASYTQIGLHGCFILKKQAKKSHFPLVVDQPRHVSGDC